MNKGTIGGSQVEAVRAHDKEKMTLCVQGPWARIAEVRVHKCLPSCLKRQAGGHKAKEP